MPVVAVMYPNADGAKFDHDYYMRSHIPMVRRLWSPLGLQDLRVTRGIAGPDGAGPPYMAVAQLTFASMDTFKAAVAKHGDEIFADIPKFTDAKPVMQFGESA